MESSEEVGVQHPSDFTPTTIPALSIMDNVMRCQICKDYFNTPMMTKCAHTFCSMCIRQALSTTGLCPTCRRPDQATNLRNNWPLIEAVTCWKKVASGVLEAVSRRRSPEEETIATDDTIVINESQSSGIPKRSIDEVEHADHNPRHRTRSKRSHDTRTHPRHHEESEKSIIEDEEKDGDYIDDDVSSITTAQAAQAAKAITVSCPICNEQMLESLVFGHLDHCTGKPAQTTHASNSHKGKPMISDRTEKMYATSQNPSARLVTKATPSAMPTFGESSNVKDKLPPAEKPAVERLSFLSYDMLKEPQFKKKLQQLGITATGNKALMKKRHMFWVDLWNSNADAETPRNRRELLKDLDIWEKSQGGRSKAGQIHPTMQKEFDREGYSAENGDQFKDLITQARESMKQKQISSDPKAESAGHMEVELASRPLSASALNPAASMFLSAASQLNADAAKRGGRRDSSALHHHSPPSLSHASSSGVSETRQVPLFQMQEQPFNDLDSDIK